VGVPEGGGRDDADESWWVQMTHAEKGSGNIKGGPTLGGK